MMRILLADDQPEVRLALRLFIEQEPGAWTVIGDASNIEALFEQAESSKPDLVLLDWELSGLQSPEAGAAMIREIRRLRPALQIIAMSMRGEARGSALEGGADAFVSKYEPADGLRTALWNAAGAFYHEGECPSWSSDQDNDSPDA